MLPKIATWINTSRHPDLGAVLWELLEGAGCEVLDRVEELSVWRSPATLERVAGFPDSVDRAVALGRLDHDSGRSWVREQRERDAAEQFKATIPKVLVVAKKRQKSRKSEEERDSWAAHNRPQGIPSPLCIDWA